MEDFASLEECTTYVEGTLILDLKNFIPVFEETPFVDAFLEPPEGIYLKGEYLPLLDLSKRFYRKDKLVMNNVIRGVIDYANSPLITNKGDILDCTSDVVNDRGDIVLTRRNIHRLRDLLTDHPGHTYNAIKAALYVAMSCIRQFCPYANITPPDHYTSFLREPYWYLEEEDHLTTALKKMVAHITSFVSNDENHIYFYKLKGTVFTLEKNVDYRIRDYYLRLAQDETPDL